MYIYSVSSKTESVSFIVEVWDSSFTYAFVKCYNWYSADQDCFYCNGTLAGCAKLWTYVSRLVFKPREIVQILVLVVIFEGLETPPPASPLDGLLQRTRGTSKTHSHLVLYVKGVSDLFLQRKPCVMIHVDIFRRKKHLLLKDHDSNQKHLNTSTRLRPCV